VSVPADNGGRRRNEPVWYRQLWPWLLMLPPVAAVGGGITMLWLATTTPAPLVVEDYAAIEAITAARFAADSQAALQGLSAEVLIDRSNATDVRMAIRLDDARRGARDAELRLHFRHATDAALDRDSVARRLGSEFRTRVSLGSGNYLMEIAPPDGKWRLAARLRPSDERIEMHPGAALR
jgi:hypothetical protein